MTTTPADIRVVINADDFGRNAAVNDGIELSFRESWITSSTVLVNMPGFEDACARMRRNDLVGRVGLHLNLTEGVPLTEAIKKVQVLCGRDGAFRGRPQALWRLDRSTAIAVRVECAAQIEALLAEGIRPTHMDSHHHIHSEWPIGAIVIDLARSYGIPAVRPTRNCGSSLGIARRLYKDLYNKRLHHAGLMAVRNFGSHSDAITLAHGASTVEVMVHPWLSASGRVLDLPSATRSVEEVWAAWVGIARLVGYPELASK